MNFLSNVLDSIPVVGHVKGVVHYAVGDTKGGHKAMYQSTRTSAVLAGGAAGCLAGPAGAVAGAMYAGLATDGIASIAMDKPQGIIEGCGNIGKDISAGRNPTGSILSTGLQVGLDGVGGLGMGGLSSAASNISEKAIAKSIENVGKTEMAKIVGKKVSEKAVKKAIEQAVIQTEVTCVAAHIGLKASKRTTKEKEEENKHWERVMDQQERREREARERKEREKQNNDAKKGGYQGTSSGSSQPPQDNNNNKKKNNQPDYFDIFMKLLKKLLKLIYGNDSESISLIFDNLSEGQIRYLIGIIRVTFNTGTLEKVLELVIKLFKGHMSKHISFENFLSLLEFVRAYLLREIDSRETESTAYSHIPHEQRGARILRDIMSDRELVEKFVRLFKKLQAEIEAETAAPNSISPDFRDIFAAVYHYFKHKFVPEDDELTVKQYYAWIRKILAKLKKKARYRQEVENQSGPVTCLYEVYVVLFGRRFRIVVKVRRGCLVLASAFVVDGDYEGDAEGDENLKIEKK